MVLSTLLSAPIMFISAQMSLLDYTQQAVINFDKLLKTAMIDVSGTAIPFGVSVQMLYSCFHHHHHRHPHHFCHLFTVY